MATWNVQPTYKKSVIERQRMYKDGQSFIVETGWRWGSFECETEDDNPPLIEEEVINEVVNKNCIEIFNKDAFL